MTETIRKKKSSFVGDVIKLSTGTAVGQALTVLVAPLLTRLYSPDTYGTATVFTSLISIIGVAVCMRYELAIVLPDSDEEAANLLGVSLGFSVLVSALTIPALWFGQDFILDLINAPGLKTYLWLVPIAVFFSGVFLAFQYWSSRTKHYGRLSISRVTRSLITTLSQLGAGYGGYATTGAMLVAGVLGQSVATFTLCGQILRDDGRFLKKHINWRDLIAGIKRYEKFPKFSTWSALSNTLSLQLPTFLLSSFFSTSVVGYYALGYSLLKVPSSLIGGAVAQVFYQRASEAKAGGTIADVVENTFKRLIMVSIFPMLLIAVIGSEIFTLILGENWTEAGVYAQILAPWILFVFIGSPMSSLMSTLEKQEIGLGFNLVLLISRGVTLALGGILGNARIALALFSATGVALWVLLCFWLLNSTGVATARTFKLFWNEFLVAVPFGLCLVSIKYIFSSSLWLVVIFCVLLVVPYIYILLRRDHLLKGFILRRLGKQPVIYKVLIFILSWPKTSAHGKL